jgi:hypothetical protein
MENQNIKKYQFVIGSSLALVGILILSFLSDPMRYFGFVFIIGAAVYFISVFYFYLIGRNNTGSYRSKTREQILKHQHRTQK